MTLFQIAVSWRSSVYIVCLQKKNKQLGAYLQRLNRCYFQVFIIKYNNNYDDDYNIGQIFWIRSVKVGKFYVALLFADWLC
jgi:hypothetical protein